MMEIFAVGLLEGRKGQPCRVLATAAQPSGHVFAGVLVAQVHEDFVSGHVFGLLPFPH